MSEGKFPPRLNVALKHGHYWAACEVGHSLFIPADTDYGATQYLSMEEHAAIVSELERKLWAIKDAANELLDEIDGQHELGGPSFEGSEPLRGAMKEIEGE